MTSAKVKIVNKNGLHARPANIFAKEALRHADCSVTIRKGNKGFNGKSIVSILSACIKCGEEIELVVDGADEKNTLNQIVDIVLNGFGE